MLPWIAVLLILLFAVFLSKNKEMFEGKKARAFSSILKTAVFLLLFSFRAFRSSSVGGDLAEYKKLFGYICGWSWQRVFVFDTGYEGGWVILNKLLSYLTNDFQIVLIFVSAVYTTALLWFCFRFSRDPWLSLFIVVAFGFWGTSFNNERQALATSFLLFSLFFVEKRNPLGFLLMMFLAISIHTTSIVFVPVYFIYGTKYKKWYLGLALAIGILLLFLAKPMLRFAIGLLPMYRNKYGEGSWDSGHGYGYLLLLVLLCVGIFLFYPTRRRRKIRDFFRRGSLFFGFGKEKRLNDFFVLLIILATVLQVFSLQMSYFQRLVKIFSFFMVIIIPLLLQGIRNKGFRIVVETVTILGLSSFYVFSLARDTISLVPYGSSIAVLSLLPVDLFLGLFFLCYFLVASGRNGFFKKNAHRHRKKVLYYLAYKERMS